MILKLIKRLFKRKKEILNTKQSNVLQRDIGRGSICVSGSDRTILLNGGAGPSTNAFNENHLPLRSGIPGRPPIVKVPVRAREISKNNDYSNDLLNPLNPLSPISPINPLNVVIASEVLSSALHHSPSIDNHSHSSYSSHDHSSSSFSSESSSYDSSSSYDAGSNFDCSNW